MGIKQQNLKDSYFRLLHSWFETVEEYKSYIKNKSFIYLGFNIVVTSFNQAAFFVYPDYK